MQFTQQEVKLIQRLRKQDRGWPRARWILLALAALALANFGYIAYVQFHSIDAETLSPIDKAEMFAFCWPIALIMVIGAGAFMGLAIRDWGGNVTRMLLLKLLDAQQKRDERDPHNT